MPHLFGFIDCKRRFLLLSFIGLRAQYIMRPIRNQKFWGSIPWLIKPSYKKQAEFSTLL